MKHLPSCKTDFLYMVAHYNVVSLPTGVRGKAVVQRGSRIVDQTGLIFSRTLVILNRRRTIGERDQRRTKQDSDPQRHAKFV